MNWNQDSWVLSTHTPIYTNYINKLTNEIKIDSFPNKLSHKNYIKYVNKWYSALIKNFEAFPKEFMN